MTQEKKPGQMTDEAKAARSQYQKQYRKAHPEKVKAWNSNYWNKKAQQNRANTVPAED